VTRQSCRRALAETVGIVSSGAGNRRSADSLQEFIYKMFITKSEQPVENRLAVPPRSPMSGRIALKWKAPRVLAIDPGTSLMGVAVLEGNDLLYYGVKELKRYRPASRLMRATQNVVSDLIDHYAPTVIAYEESVYVQQLGSAMLRVVEREIRRTAKAAGLHGVSYTPADVRQSLCGNPWATKHIVAAQLVERFPELAGYRTGQSPRSERYWLNMFDALAVAVVAVNDLERGSGPLGGGQLARAA
jgi:Holliday junction resolvasome RuvABC endonuclease subunit